MRKYFLIIDLEATCWSKGDWRTPDMEIIEIGAVLYNRQLKQIQEEFQTFVKPVRHPELSEFCTNLTSIKQNQVDNAPFYPEAMEKLKTEMLGVWSIARNAFSNLNQ